MTLFKQIALGMALVLVFACCEENMEHYERPDYLAGPIYQQLEKEGRFENYLTLLDTIGYKNILNRTGYFTVLAPNDSAFNIFLQDKGFVSLNQLDTVTMKQIVQYSIIDNGYTRRTLAAYQSSGGWVYDVAFRRLTRANEYYHKDTIFKKEVYEGSNKVIKEIEGEEVYIRNRENKHVPYFIDLFMNKQGLSSENLNKFFPGIGYDGFNIMDARVINDNLIAENGYIYELGKVLTPLPNFDEYLVVHPQAGEMKTFKSILDMVSYGVYDSAVYQSLPVYTKSFEAMEINKVKYSVDFPVNYEGWLTGVGGSNASQINCWTLFVPSNQAMEQLLNDKILKHYASLDEIIKAKRANILFDIINDHMFYTAIWPEKMASNTAAFGKSLTDNDFFAYNMASNGFFYGINTVLESSNSFTSVFSEVYLNPEYSFMYDAMMSPELNLKNILTNREIKYTLLLTPNSVFKAAGWDNAILGYFYKTSDPSRKLNEEFYGIINSLILKGQKDDFSGNGVLLTNDGGFLKYENNQVWAGGNEENGSKVNINQLDVDVNNGVLYKTNGLLLQPTRAFNTVLSTPPSGASFASFKKYVDASGVFEGNDLKEFVPGLPFTLLVPTDAAIATAGLPDPATTDSIEKIAIKRFVEYHIIPDESLFTDAALTGGFKTAYVTGITGRLRSYATVVVGGSKNNLTVTDKMGNTANVLNNNASNIITVDKRIILQIDKVLEFE
jgi:uncharacterized surface protein with fasciclin (FAS1) repeats